VSKVDLPADLRRLRRLVSPCVASYRERHDSRRGRSQFPPVGRIELTYWLSGDAPMVCLNLDTRENGEPDGSYSHPEYGSREFRHWLPALARSLEGKAITFVGLDGKTSTTRNVDGMIGRFLVACLKTLREEGAFRALPTHPRCELAVEEVGGGFGWPHYGKRGQDNLL